MFLPIEGGSVINIQGLDCHIPPVGFVIDIKTKELREIGVYSRSEIQSEQYWERIKPPTWYFDVLKEEDRYNKYKKDDSEPYFNEQYEQYKQTEWDRRLHGFWYMSNGKPIYLVGAHYLFMQHTQIDIGYPKFREPDLEYFYFLQYVIEDPECMGMLEITKRRFGKTYRGGIFVLDYPTRTKMTNGAIQSKTGQDAKKVFAKAVVDPFKKWPRFFKPEYDLSGGVTPKSELRFQNTNVRGKKAEENLEKEELGSLIDFYSADALATDGQKIHRKFDDEWCKTVETNIYERHEVTRYCLMDDEGRIIGKVLYSSTVEVLDTEKDGVQEAAITLWNDSDQMNKGENGRTASGLYRFFMTADRAKNFDIYGVPNVEKTVKEILADRETVKHNQRSWAARVRKEARTIKEAFYAGNDRCEYNAENIANQIQWIEDNPGECYWRQCRLVSKKKIVKSVVIGKPDRVSREIGFMDDQKGGWFILEEPLKPNAFIQIGETYEPQNKIQYQIGVDTTQDRIAVEGSNPAIVVFKKSLIINGVEEGLYPVALWISPTRLDIHFDEEVMKACLWYGCEANYEIDRRTDFYRLFCKEGCGSFLTWTPPAMINPLKKKNFKLEYGSRSGDPFQLGQMLQISKLYIDGDSNDHYNGHVHRMKHKGLLQQGLEYDHLDRTKSDLWVALQMALVPVLGESQMPLRQPAKIKQLLPTYKLKKAN
jgi:hypothetical protein